MKTEWLSIPTPAYEKDEVFLRIDCETPMVLGGVTKLKQHGYGAMTVSKGKIGVFHNKEDARSAVEQNSLVN